MTKAKTGFDEMIERSMQDLEEKYRYASPEDETPAKPQRKTVVTNSDLLDIKEAANYLSVSVRTVARLMKHKQITYSYVRGSLRFEKIELDRYLEKRTVKAR